MIICGRWKMDDDRNNRKSISSSWKSTSCCNNLTYPLPHHTSNITISDILLPSNPASLVLGRAGRYCVTNFPSFSPVHNIQMSAINQFRRPPGGKKCGDYPLIAQHEHIIACFPGQHSYVDWARPRCQVTGKYKNLNTEGGQMDSRLNR